MRERDNKRGGLLAGIILIAFGCMFLLDRFVVVDFGQLIGTYWPMIIVVVGALRLTERNAIWSGLWLIAVGTWMQLTILGLFGLNWSNSWPLILIILGVGMVARSLFDATARKEERHEP